MRTPHIYQIAEKGERKGGRDDLSLSLSLSAGVGGTYE